MSAYGNHTISVKWIYQLPYIWIRFRIYYNIEIRVLKNSYPFLQTPGNKWITCVIFRSARLIISYCSGQKRKISRCNFIDHPHTWLIIICKVHVIASLVWLLMKTFLYPCNYNSFVRLKFNWTCLQNIQIFIH